MGENESASSSVIQPADTSTPVQESVTGSELVTGDTSTPVETSGDASTPATGDTSQIYTGPYQVVAQVVKVPDRPFFETPFEEYTVTEGLLLLLVVLFVIRWITGMLKGGFSWL